LLPVFTAESPAQKGYVQIVFSDLQISALLIDDTFLHIGDTSSKRLPIPTAYLRCLTPQDWRTGEPFEHCVVESIVLRELSTVLEDISSYSQLFPFLKETFFKDVTPTRTSNRHLFPRFTSKQIDLSEADIAEFFNKETNDVIEVNPPHKPIVLKNAKPGVIYTSKQTSAGNIYKFEQLYMSWQVKYGVSKAFGTPASKAEVEKAILHDSTNADIQFVIVIVAQKLTKFFSDKMRKEEKFCNIIRCNHKDLAIQFNPGYVMKIVQRGNTKKLNQPPQKSQGRTTPKNWTTKKKEKI